MSEQSEALALLKPEDSQELQTTAAVSRAQAEIQAAIVIAKKYLRDETAAYQKLLRSADRVSFAEDCAYSFPRGGTQVTGPSVILAREAARIWGNIRYGLVVLRDDDQTRLIRGWAWDLESNTYVEADDDFTKLIQRKDKKTQQTAWIEPDERDLRELTNRRGAILVRNCILQLIPKDFIEDTIARADYTVQKGAKSDPEAWKKIVSSFGEINVKVAQLTAYLGHSVADCSPTELTRLRQIYKSIVDGNSTWQEYGEPAKPKPAVERGVLEDISILKQSAEPNRGHNQEGFAQNGVLKPQVETKAPEVVPEPETQPERSQTQGTGLMRGVVKVKDVEPRMKKIKGKPDQPYFLLILEGKASPIYVWHQSLHEFAVKMKGREVDLEVESSQSQGKVYWSLENIYSVTGPDGSMCKFVGNKPVLEEDIGTYDEQPTGAELFPPVRTP